MFKNINKLLNNSINKLLNKDIDCVEIVANWYAKEKNLLLLSFSFGFIITLIFTFASISYSETIQGGIAKEVVRFHVLANSNSDDDQALKLKVRDGILEEFKPMLNSSNSFDETICLLTDNLDKITDVAKKIISENGYNYAVTAKVTKSIFPTKEYGDVTLPAGEYNALRIEIGEAKGNNWWCVMFPPLCFVDITQGTVPQNAKNELKNILSDEEYKLVADTKTTNDTTVKVKFKIVEVWQKFKTSSVK